MIQLLEMKRGRSAKTGPVSVVDLFDQQLPADRLTSRKEFHDIQSLCQGAQVQDRLRLYILVIHYFSRHIEDLQVAGADIPGDQHLRLSIRYRIRYQLQTDSRTVRNNSFAGGCKGDTRYCRAGRAASQDKGPETGRALVIVDRPIPYSLRCTSPAGIVIVIGNIKA